MLAVVSVATLISVSTAFGHAGHSHDLPIGPPTPDWAWSGAPEHAGGQQADLDIRGQASFTADLAAAPAEKNGECTKTVEFDDLGDGCRTRDGLLRLELPNGESSVTHGPDFIESQLDTDATTMPPHMVAAVRNASASDIECVPTTERYTQVVYAIPADGVDRSAAMVEPLRGAVYAASAVIDAEARSLTDGAAGRRLSVRCTEGGAAHVEVLRLRRTSATTEFADIQADMHALLGSASSTGTVRYLVYYDAHLGSFGGIGNMYNDEDPTEDNLNNSGGRTALQDNSSGSTMPSWKILLHEAGHNMGAVQDNAPDSNNVSHCNDGLDVMCYAEPLTVGVQGIYSSSVCDQMRFDCDHDTYFHPAPAGGSYLDTNWNVAGENNWYLTKRTAAVDDAPPSTPTGLAGSGHGAFIRLTWNASSDGAGSGVTGYRVYRDAGGGDWQVVGDAWPGETTFDARWDGIAASTSYDLRVTAYDAIGNESSHASITTSSGVVTGTPQYVGGGPLPAPTNVRITENSANGINVEWDPIVEGSRVLYYVEADSDVDTWWWTTYGSSRSFSSLAAAKYYTVTVKARDEDGRESAGVVVHAWTTGGPDVTAPAQPAGLTKTSVDGNVPTISWNAVAGATTYLIDVYDAVTETTTTVATTSHTYAAVRGLPYGVTRPIGVRARDEAGNISTTAWLAPSHTTQAAPDFEPPSSPTVPTYGWTTTSITPTWTASTDNVGVTGYRVYIGKRDSQDVKFVGQTGPDNGQRTLQITGLIPDTEYSVRIQAMDAAGNGSSTNTWWYLWTQPDVQDPTTPTGMATSAHANTSMQVSWNASTDNSGVSHYELERQDGASWVPVTTTPLTSHTVTGLQLSTSYTFRVRAVDVAGLTSAFAQATGMTTGVPDVEDPSQPEDISVGSVTGTSVGLSWGASTDNVGVAGYRVYRLSPNPSGVAIASPSGTSTTITGLDDATAYEFAVTAVDGSGNESIQSTIIVTTIDTTAPSVPTGLGATALGETSIRITWAAASDNVAVTGYEIQKVVAGVGTPIGTTATTQFDATGLAPGASHTFRVRAYDAAANYSPHASVTQSTPDLTAPTAPTALEAAATTDTWIRLAWSPATDLVGVTDYVVYQTSPAAGELEVVAGSPYRVEGLTAGTSYTFEVTARDAAGNESPAATLTTSTLAAPDTGAPSPPTGLAVTAVTLTGGTITWTAPADADLDHVLVQRKDGAAWQTVHTASDVATEYTFTGLAAGTTYSVRLIAVDDSGNESTPTDVVQLTTTQAADTIPPSPPGTAIRWSADALGNVGLAWDAFSDDTGVAQYRIWIRSGGAWSHVGSTHLTSFALASITQGWSTIGVSAVDAAGNQSTRLVEQVHVPDPPPMPPGTPTALSGSATKDTITLSWQQPDAIPGTSWMVDSYVGSEQDGAEQVTTPSITLRNLESNTRYTLYVTATNADGDSAPASIEIRTLPDATANRPDRTKPTRVNGVKLSARGKSRVLARWLPARDAGGIARYELQVRAPRTRTRTYRAASRARSTTLTRLPRRATITVRVRAVDRAGNRGAWSKPAKIRVR